MTIAVIVPDLGFVRWNRAGRRTIRAYRERDFRGFRTDVERALRWGPGLNAAPEIQALAAIEAFPGARLSGVETFPPTGSPVL